MIARISITVLLFILTQISVYGQGFEFLYSTDTAELVRNDFSKVYYEDGNIIGDIKFSSQHYRRMESKLIKFNINGDVIKKSDRVEDDFQYKFHRGNFKAFNDSLLFSRRFMTTDNLFFDQILLTDKNIEGMRVLLSDTVNEIRDFTLNNDNEITILSNSGEKNSFNTLLEKYQLPSMDTVWTIDKNIEGIGLPQMYLYLHENIRGEYLAIGARDYYSGVIMTYIDGLQNTNPVYDFNWSFTTGITTGGPMFLKDEAGDFAGFAAVHHEADFLRKPDWIEPHENSMTYGHLKLYEANGSFTFPYPANVINDSIHDYFIVGPEITDFAYHDGYYYYCGSLGGNFFDERGFLLKMSDRGDLVYFKLYQYQDHPFNEIRCLHFVDDDNLVLAGLTWAEKNLYFDRGYPVLEKKNNAAWAFNICPETGEKKINNPSCDTTTGLIESRTEKENKIKIYPNPVTTAQLYIESNREISTVEIYSIQGRLVFAGKYGANRVELPIKNIAGSSGLYVCKITTLNGLQYVEKIIIR